MNLPKYSLDTHPLIWYFTGQEKKLSVKARKILDGVFSGDHGCFVSTIVLLEAFHLSLRKKEFIFPEFLKSLRLPNIIIVPLDKVVLTTCYGLPKHLDIHDRVITATAKVSRCVLVTKDKMIEKVSKIKTIW